MKLLKNVSGSGRIENPLTRMRMTENDQKKPVEIAQMSPRESMWEMGKRTERPLHGEIVS